MRSTILAAFLLLLQSCSLSWTARPDPLERFKHCVPSSGAELQMVFVPGYGEAAVVVEECASFRREKVSIAFQAFEAEWRKTFGSAYKISKNLREMIVTFSFERKYSSGYDAFGNPIAHATIHGTTISKNAVWVYIEPTVDRICDTSLIHELVHASIWTLSGTHGDPDHSGRKYLGWTQEHNGLIQRVNDYLCELGI